MPVFVFNGGQNANGALFIIVVVLFSMMFFMTLFQTLVEDDSDFKMAASDLARLKPKYLVKPPPAGKIAARDADQQQQQASFTISTQLFSSFLSRFKSDSTAADAAAATDSNSETVKQLEEEEHRVAPFLSEMRQAGYQAFSKTNMGTDSLIWTFPHVTNDTVHVTVVFPRVLNDTLRISYYSLVKYYSMPRSGPFAWKLDGEQTFTYVEMSKHVGNCEWEHEYIKSNIASFCWKKGAMQTDIWHIDQPLEMTAFEWKHYNDRSCVYYALENDEYEFRYQCREQYETTQHHGPLADRSKFMNTILAMHDLSQNNETAMLAFKFDGRVPSQESEVYLITRLYLEQEQNTWILHPNSLKLRHVVNQLLKQLPSATPIHKSLFGKQLTVISENKQLLLMSITSGNVVVADVNTSPSNKSFNTIKLFDYSDFLPYHIEYDDRRYDRIIMLGREPRKIAVRAKEVSPLFISHASGRYSAVKVHKNEHLIVFQRMAGIEEYEWEAPFQIYEQSDYSEKRKKIIFSTFVDSESNIDLMVMYDDSSIATYSAGSSSIDNQYADSETLLGSIVKTMLIFLLARWKLLFVTAIIVGGFIMNEVNIRRRRAQQQPTTTQQQQPTTDANNTTAQQRPHQD